MEWREACDIFRDIMDEVEANDPYEEVESVEIRMLLERLEYNLVRDGALDEVPDDLTLCDFCLRMTKTTPDKDCGKCGNRKNDE